MQQLAPLPQFSKFPALQFSVKLPDAPYLAAAVCGGPSVAFLVTPLRNALTFGCLDSSKSAPQLYKDVFAGGVRQAWGGGKYVACAALPGFLVLGPFYHMCKDITGGNAPAAVAMTSVAESCIFYGSETRCAQIAYNNVAQARNAPVISRLHSPYNALGSGVGFYTARNMLAMSGLRVMSTPCQGVIQRHFPSMPTHSQIIFGDFLANVCASTLSTPLHQLYGWSVTHRHASAAAGVSKESLLRGAVNFLRSQYFTASGHLKCTAGRDVLLRVAYNATIFTLYGSIERAVVASWDNAWSSATPLLNSFDRLGRAALI
eukprot:TRINITY_DN3563_c1_g2_i1.p1 TRINITY_DN3563_c1_g2~~TRINITY_DN3563_c1_g2_i1.p1  ORF type:complete len:317 (+),score=24.88 TRINITY_DN3563_c1_g2_i1:67-1017(+)